MKKDALDQLRMELALKAKSGIDFIIAAAIIWGTITYVWTLNYTSYNKSVLTFIVGSIMLPLAFGFSKILKTTWKVKDNPLDALGLWFNVAQLFYFPLLFFALGDNPDSFIMVYAVITGAHFFPYAWYYREISYAIMAGVIPIGAFLIATFIGTGNLFFVPLYVAACLAILVTWLAFSNSKKQSFSASPA